MSHSFETNAFIRELARNPSVASRARLIEAWKGALAAAGLRWRLGAAVVR